jgi:2-iminoacetate synthase ThiH
MTPAMMEDLIHKVGRRPRQRTTLYATSIRRAAAVSPSQCPG